MNNNIMQALYDQYEELLLEKQSQYIPREAALHIPAKTKLVKIIIGVRRSGKSTLAHLLLAKKQYAYVNFDDERLSTLHSSDLSVVIKGLHEIYGDFSCLFLDEIQNIPDWSLFVNRLKRQGFEIVITG